VLKPAPSRVNFCVERENSYYWQDQAVAADNIVPMPKRIDPHFYPGVQEGEILLMVVMLQYATSEVSRKVGYVFQNPRTTLRSDRREGCRLWPRELGLPRSEIRERSRLAMGITGTTELKIAPYELSGGQQRGWRLRHFGHETIVVVMDEPTLFSTQLQLRRMKAVADLRLEHELP